jgi:hypothetical protein
MEPALMKAKDEFKILMNNKESFDTMYELIKPEPVIKHLLDNESFKKHYDKEIKLFLDKSKFILKFIADHSEDSKLFNYFLEILLHTKQYQVAKLIAEDYLADILDLNRCHPKDGSVEKFSFGHKIEPDKLKISEKSGSSQGSRYPMDKNPVGYCVLINNYLTFGTFKEMQRFRNIFYQLNYDVVMAQNLDHEELFGYFSTLSKNLVSGNYCALFIMILSHGTKNNEILSFDNMPINIDTLMNLFNNEKCRYLLNKPRIFIFNCCRGNEDDYGITDIGDGYIPKTLNSSTAENSNINNDAKIKSQSSSESKEIALGCFEFKNKELMTKILPKPEFDDYLVCFTTLKGLKAYANWDSGTDFGRNFADKLVDYGYEKDVHSIISKTSKALSKEDEEDYNRRKQLWEKHQLKKEPKPLRTIMTEHTLRKTFYFYSESQKIQIIQKN